MIAFPGHYSNVFAVPKPNNNLEPSNEYVENFFFICTLLRRFAPFFSQLIMELLLTCQMLITLSSFTSPPGSTADL